MLGIVTKREALKTYELDYDAALQKLYEEEYLKVAEQVGYRPWRPPDRQPLTALLAAEKIRVYNYDKVMRYLNRQSVSLNHRVTWKPLRDSDRVGNTRDLPVANMLYRNLVPLEALQMVCKLSAKNSELGFYVSDYEVVKPDPFLAVAEVDRQERTFKFATDPLVVIAHWDEPKWKD